MKINLLKTQNQKNQNDLLSLTARGALGFLIFLASIPSLSAVPYRDAFEEMDTINHQTNELNLDVFARMQAVIDKMAFKPENYIPLNGIPDRSSGDRVSAKILQKTVQTLIDSNTQNSAVREVQKYTSNYERSVSKSDYKMSFKVTSTRAKAEVSYAKYVTAVLSYDVIERGSGMNVEVTHPLNNDRVLAYTHGMGTFGTVEDRLGIRWSF